MYRYCEACHVAWDTEDCPMCGRQRLREIRPEDPCYLTEKEWIWGEMLEDVLKQNDIPFMRKNVLGAAVAIKTGLMRERVRIYVPFREMARASRIVKELFNAPPEEKNESGGE